MYNDIYKKNIEHSQQWKGFTAELFDAVQQQLVESHVNFFTDLSEAEKTLFLERAAKAIRRGNAYKEVVLQISSCLEDQLSSCVAIEMQESGSVSTRSERFQSHVRYGMVNLLHKWPDMKYKLHALFNQPLSSEIRKVAWRLFLSNTKARMEYLTRVSKNTAKFSIDLDISMKCDTLLSTEPTFKHLQDSKSDEPGESLCRGVENILQAALGVLFVGYLNMTTLLYIWDQEEREALRMNHIEKMKQEERHRKLREEEEIRLEEERLQRQLEETKRINNEQRLYLEEQLAEERQHRYDIQKNAEEQIGLLQAEIRKIKGDRQPSVDIFTVNSFGTPPPSIESKSPVQNHQLPPLTQQNTTQDNTALPGSMSKTSTN
ncbi:hypothetical protein AOXY_G35382 [Acipenser oxyrinchus oxyrinchus]|uniref:Uncharacterized protein n=1 Tax=Acipenser oxyrinchus oxyrinchus TaxID=40147 RepID=A0AAD8CEY6_ACIOX|nr:hypothetical protein AOXY_G35382 [Acipenser oxyrinchus oxyrinchus]